MIKIFAHRGYVIKGIAQNSIESLKAAYENNFVGVEFDVWFVENKLVLSHDQPSLNAISSLPKFSDYFIYGNKIKYWIDFKNLNIANVDKALLAVKKEVEEFAISKKNIYFAPFIEDLNEAIFIYDKIRVIFGEDAQIMAVCVKIEDGDMLKYYKKLRENNIKFLSILHKNINKNFVDIFKEIEIFAWTVNDVARLRELEALGVKNCTSDIITPSEIV